LFEQKVTCPSQHAWLAKLLGFDYEIEFKKGKDNVVVDALLRVTCGTLSTITVSSLSTILLAAIKESWQKDKDVQLLIQELTLRPNSHPHYSWVNQLLCRKGKLVVGQLGPLQTQIISLYHDSATGGHSGTTVTAKRVANGFYWKGQQKHVRQYIRECPICQQNKSENTRTPGLLQPLPIATAPFIDISMYFVEGLPKSKGREVIFVVVDIFSKYAHFMAIPHPYTAYFVTQVFVDNVYKLHGFPATIVSDRDTVFLSLFWKELFVRQDVKLWYSTAYHPQSNGQTEVVNKCLENYLRCMTSASPTWWVQWLPLAEWWYNTNYHTATKSTPYEILYGYPPPLHIPYFPKDSPVDAVDNFLYKREQILQAVKKNLQNARHRMIQLANKHRSER
jgi:hypothetical protein